MASWSNRRKSVFALIVVILLLVGVGVPAFLILYEKPTCSDGLMNGDEQGTDCGGSCMKLCSSSFIPLPSPSWVRSKEISPRLFNLAAYVVNPNPSGSAKNLPYVFELIDTKGLKITDAKGVIFVPPGKNTLAFEGAVSSGAQDPARVVFRFVGEPDWEISSNIAANLEVTSKDYNETPDGSSLTVTIRNSGAATVRNITVYAILKNQSDTVLDFSKTVVDEIRGESTEIAPFTWPFNHNGEVISIEVLLVAE